MTDEPHTPTTLEIRKAFISLDGAFANGSWGVGSLKRFDRWYQDEIAAAEQRGAEQGWDEAMTKQIQRLISGDPDVERFQMPANPYRADRIEGEQ